MLDHESITYLLGGALWPYVEIVIYVVGFVLVVIVSILCIAAYTSKE